MLCKYQTSEEGWVGFLVFYSLLGALNLKVAIIIKWFLSLFSKLCLFSGRNFKLMGVNITAVDFSYCLLLLLQSFVKYFLWIHESLCNLNLFNFLSLSCSINMLLGFTLHFSFCALWERDCFSSQSIHIKASECMNRYQYYFFPVVYVCACAVFLAFFVCCSHPNSFCLKNKQNPTSFCVC